MRCQRFGKQGVEQATASIVPRSKACLQSVASRANSARIVLLSLNGQTLILQELKVGSIPTVSANRVSN